MTVTYESPGWPVIRNPMVCAIWAPNMVTGTERASDEAILERLFALMGHLGQSAYADLIAAGEVLVAASARSGEGRHAARPFMVEGSWLRASRHDAGALGMATLYLLWALEWIQLGSMPWGGCCPRSWFV
jgi:hypothetical protein